MKGVNNAGGKNRLRFQKFSYRLQRLNADVIHRVHHETSRSLSIENPDGGSMSCFFNDELEQCKVLDMCATFRRFYFEISPRVQSLPELIHHKKRVVELLVSHLRTVDNIMLPTYLKLTSVLGRDLQEDLFPFFKDIFGTLTSRILAKKFDGSVSEVSMDPLSPEVQGAVFETMSYLVKYLRVKLVEDYKPLFQYYGPLLGHYLPHVRQLAVSCFVLIPKKLAIKPYISHSRRLIKAIVSNFYTKSTTSMQVEDRSLLTLNPIDLEGFEQLSRNSEEAASKDFSTVWNVPAHLQDVVDGATSLIAQSWFGIKGNMHSKGGEKLTELLSFLYPLLPSQNDSIRALHEAQQATDTVTAATTPSKKKGKAASGLSKESIAALETALTESSLNVDIDVVSHSLSCWIAVHSTRKLFRHVHPSELLEVWLRILSISQSISNSWESLRSLSAFGSVVPSSAILNLIVKCAISSSYMIELAIFGITHSNSRALADENVRSNISKALITTICRIVKDCLTFDFDSCLLADSSNKELFEGIQLRVTALKARSTVLFCNLWLQFPTDKAMLSRADGLLSNMLSFGDYNFTLGLIADKLLPKLPTKIIRSKLIIPILASIASLGGEESSRSTVSSELWLSCLLGILYSIDDDRVDVFQTSQEAINSQLAEGSHSISSSVASNQQQQLIKPAFDKSAAAADDWDNENAIHEQSDGSNDDDDEPSDESESDHKRRKGIRRFGDFKFYKAPTAENSDKIRNSRERSSEFVKILSESSNYLLIISQICVDKIIAQLSAAKAISSDEQIAFILRLKVINWLITCASSIFETKDDKAKELKDFQNSIAKLVEIVSAVFTMSSNIENSKNSKKRAIKDAQPTQSESSYNSLLIFIQSFGRRALFELTSVLQNLVFNQEILLSSSLANDVKTLSTINCELFKAVSNLIISENSSEKSCNSLSILATLETLLSTCSHLNPSNNNDDNSCAQVQQLIALATLLPATTIQQLFDRLAFGLQASSHWLKLICIRILRNFPFVFCDLQLTIASNGFYEIQVISTYWKKKISAESNSNLNSNSTTNSSEQSKSKLINEIIFICEKILLTCASLQTERELIRLLGKLEVLARMQSIPEPLLRALGCFCIGLLHIKFFPVWEAAIGVLIAMTNSSHLDGEELVWQLLAYSIDPMSKVNRITAKIVDNSASDNNNSNQHESNSNIVKTIRYLSQTSIDSGSVSIPVATALHAAFYYRGTQSFVVEAAVDADARADFDAVYSHLWSILKKCPSITARKSKLVVPYFLRFLTEEYYPFHPNSSEIAFLVYSGVLPQSVLESTSQLQQQQQQQQEQSNEEADQQQQQQQQPGMTTNTIRKRLEMFLDIFSVVVNPRQLYKSQQLFSLFLTLFLKAEASIANLCLECLSTYKFEYISPYKQNLSNLINDKKFRDELVSFNIARRDASSVAAAGGEGDNNNSSSGSAIESIHRPQFVHVLQLIVFGRMMTKVTGNKSKDQKYSRRVAFLQFIANLSNEELRVIISQIIQTILPSSKLYQLPELLLSSEQSNSISASFSSYNLVESYQHWHNGLDQIIATLSPNDFANVFYEKQIGFLNLLSVVIHAIGLGLSPYVNQLCGIAITMLTQAQQQRDALSITKLGDSFVEESIDIGAIEEPENMWDDSMNSVVNQLIRIRTLSVQVLAAMVKQYHARVDFSSTATAMFIALAPLITALPQTISSCKKVPALLHLLHELALHTSTIESTAAAIEAVIRCIGITCEPNVMSIVIDILIAIVDRDDGVYLKNYSQLIIESFCKRFVGNHFSAEDYQSLTLSQMTISPSGSIIQELRLLSKISEVLFSNGQQTAIQQRSNQSSIALLAMLLLSMLRTYTTTRKVRITEEWVVNILRIYNSLVPSIENIGQHIAFLSKLFGPTSHSLSLFNRDSVRAMLIEVYATISEHSSTMGILRTSNKSLQMLTAKDKTLVGSRNFDYCIPAFQALAEETDPQSASIEKPTNPTWHTIIGAGNCKQLTEISHCTVIIHECFRCMMDEEAPIRNSATIALKALISNLTNWCAYYEEVKESQDKIGLVCGWLDILVSIILPAIHSGMNLSKDMHLKGFVQLLAHFIRSIGQYIAQSQLMKDSNTNVNQIKVIQKKIKSLHLDMIALMHIDVEQDFFENIIHLQLHRRIRCMNKLQKSLIGDNNKEVMASIASSIDSNSDAVAIDVATEEEEEEQQQQQQEKAEIASAKTYVYSEATLVKVMLPLALHAITSDEFEKRDHINYVQESAKLIAAIASNLSWSAYQRLVRMLLSFVGKCKPEREKILHALLTYVLDAFHFDVSGCAEVSGIAVATTSKFGGSFALTTAHLTDYSDPNIFLPSKRGSTKDNAAKSSNAVSAATAVTAPPTRKLIQSTGKDIATETLPEEFEAVGVDSRIGTADEEDIDETAEGDQDATGNNDATALTTASTAATDSHTKVRWIMNTIIPTVSKYLLKDEKDHLGNSSKTVRTQVAVSLTKLLTRLKAPVISDSQRITQFMNLVIKVINTLKSKDSDARDAARDSLSKMILTMGIDTLKLVIYEMQHILTEGYQRHVCNFSLRNILSTVLATYSPPNKEVARSIDVLQLLSFSAEGSEDPLSSLEIVKPELDMCVPMIMQSVMDDLLGQAAEDMHASESGGAKRSVIKEAKGSRHHKAFEILDLITRNILFRPTYALKAGTDPCTVSSIHAITFPLLQALQTDSSMESINKIGEALSRVAIALCNNKSVEAPELLLYLHSTLHPFIVKIIKEQHKQQVLLGKLGKSIKTPSIKSIDNSEGNDLSYLDIDDRELLGDELPSYLRDESSDEEESALYSEKRLRNSADDDIKSSRAESWLPSERNALRDQRSVLRQREQERWERTRVIDGVNAPRLTGVDRKRGRTDTQASSASSTLVGSDAGTIAAVKFCITVFQLSLKHNKIENSFTITTANNSNNSNNSNNNNTAESITSMILPFLPLLAQCLNLSNASTIVSNAMRCICTVLEWGIPVQPRFGRAIGNKMMKLLVSGGGLISTDNDLVQACIKGLSSLFRLYHQRATAAKATAKTSAAETEQEDEEAAVIPLSDEHIRSLIQLLTVSITDIASNSQTVTFGLIKIFVEMRLMFPEIYDLISKLLEQIALSQRSNVRDSASSVVITFLLTYPMGKARLEGHIKQLIANCSFEYEEGRESSLVALASLVKGLSQEMLEEIALLIFLPMTLRLVNDKSIVCRERASYVITCLCKRVNADQFSTLFEYSSKWLSSGVIEANAYMTMQMRSLIRTGAQVVRMLISSRNEQLNKKGNNNRQITETIEVVRRTLLAIARKSSEYYTTTASNNNSNSNRGRSRVSSLWKREMATSAEGVNDSGTAEDWSIIYQLLCLIEVIYQCYPAVVDSSLSSLSLSSDNSNNSCNSSSSSSSSSSSNALLTIAASHLMEIVQESLLYPHVWVRSVACRILYKYIDRRKDLNLSDPNSSAQQPQQEQQLTKKAKKSLQQQQQQQQQSSEVTSNGGFEILRIPNALYHMCRRLCVVLNQPVIADSLLSSLLPSVVFAVCALAHNPTLTAVNANEEAEEEEEDDEEEGEAEDSAAAEDGVEEAEGELIEAEEHDNDNDDDDEEEDIESNEVAQSSNKRSFGSINNNNNSSNSSSNSDSNNRFAACNWAMQRLKHIGADTRGHRRRNVLQVFKMLIERESKEFVTTYMHYMLEICIRAVQIVAGPDEAITKEVKELGTVVIDLIQRKVDATAFIPAYAAAQKLLSTKRLERKRQSVLEAVTNPTAFAQKKMIKTEQKKAAHKRKNHQFEARRGFKKERVPKQFS